MYGEHGESDGKSEMGASLGHSRDLGNRNPLRFPGIPILSVQTVSKITNCSLLQGKFSASSFLLHFYRDSLFFTCLRHVLTTCTHEQIHLFFTSSETKSEQGTSESQTTNYA